MNKIEQFVVDYIQREYTFPEGTNVMALNYVDTGYVDSLGLIQFISTIEDEFGIEFTDEDMECPDIKVIGKLINMIENKIKLAKTNEAY